MEPGPTFAVKKGLNQKVRSAAFIATRESHNDRGVVPAKEGGRYTTPPDRSENNAAHPNPAIHSNELPPPARPAPYNTWNPNLDKKYQQQQDKLYKQQERKKLQQIEDQEHQRIAQQKTDEARKQQHQQQMQQLQQKPAQQQQKLQERQPPPLQNPPKPPPKEKALTVHYKWAYRQGTMSPSREETLFSDLVIIIAGTSITITSHDLFMTGVSLVIGLVFWIALYFSRKRIVVLKRSSGTDQVTFELSRVGDALERIANRVVPCSDKPTSFSLADERGLGVNCAIGPADRAVAAAMRRRQIQPPPRRESRLYFHALTCLCTCDHDREE